MDGKLTKTDQKNLTRCERVITEGLVTFFGVGQALWDIREGRLYRGRYETFEQYCVERWEFTRQRAYQLISAAETAAEMSTVVDRPPERETHVRPLLAVPKEHRAEVWQAVLDAAEADADGRPIVTGRLVQSQVDRWHDRRKVDGPGPAPEPAVIDVESRPVEPARNQYLDEIPCTLDAGEACPECGSTDLDEDVDGRYCRRCKATIEEPQAAEEEPDQVAADSPDDELLEHIERQVRAQFAGRLAIAAVRLATLVDRLRSEL